MEVKKLEVVSCLLLLQELKWNVILSFPSGRGFSIEIDATNTAFKNGTNRVLVVLLAADGSTEVDRKTFIVEITSRKISVIVLHLELLLFVNMFNLFS